MGRDWLSFSSKSIGLTGIQCLVLSCVGCGLSLSVTADQSIGRAVVLELSFSAGFQFRDDAFCERFTELDASLIERINVINDALGKSAVFVQRNKFSQGFRR